MTLLDLSSTDDQHFAQRLESETIAWLGSVDGDGQPHQVPVWFGWKDRTAAVFSTPAARKVRNLRARPLCSLGIETSDSGNDVVILHGSANVLDPAAAWELAADVGFVEKYSALMGDGWFDAWVGTFSTPIRIDVTRMIAWHKPGGELRFRDAR